MGSGTSVGRQGDLTRGTRGFWTSSHVALVGNKTRMQEGKEEERGSFECPPFHLVRMRQISKPAQGE